MSSRSHGSEEALAVLALREVKRRRAVLVGGLGIGFTLRAALDRLPAQARVVVAELVPELVSWNRGPLAGLSGHPLDDPRVRVVVGDVLDCLAEGRETYDAILLDVDNGPASHATAVWNPANGRLYRPRGIAICASALNPGGTLAVWSAGPAPRYVRALQEAGLKGRAQQLPAEGSGSRHVLILATRPSGMEEGDLRRKATDLARLPKARRKFRSSEASLKRPRGPG
jgi:spermidine synthase